MGPSEKQSQAIRRSTRLPLEVPVLVTSLDPDSAFSEQCNTTLVNAHGCGLITQREITRGVRVRLEIVSAKRHTTGRVAEVVPLGGDPETWLLGLELEVPGNFWGIEYAPSDWTADETSLLAALRPEAHEPAAQLPSRRWRLTDISAGACYLETVAPFPAGMPVLLSIRAANSECLLDGVVRASHAQVGMGVEFLQTADYRTRVQELIGRLRDSREVPRIFVGRKERPQKHDPGLDFAGVESAVPQKPDPLLELIREAPHMSVEQFVSDLKAQRLGKRRDPRIDVALPVLLTGTDESGRPLDQRVTTVNISRRGALLEGIYGRLGPGDRVVLARGNKKEQFRVAWVGDAGTPSDGQIGVAAVDPNTTFWERDLELAQQAIIEVANLRGPADGT
jgi:hypothetical protein